MLTGCAKEPPAEPEMLSMPDEEQKVNVILTNGEDPGQVFRIGTAVCSIGEARLYLYGMQSRYEQIYGDDIWNREANGVRLEDKLKNVTLSRLVQIKSMALMAKDRGVELDESEQQLVDRASSELYDSFSMEDVMEFALSKDQVRNCFEEMALADKVYNQIISETDPEISDDEARIVTVSQILLKTYTQSHQGTKEVFSDEQKQEVYQKALSLLARLNQGEDFDQVAAANNEADRITISFGKGQMEPAMEEAAFSLGQDEISRIIDTEQGYVILKCVQSFDREQTDLRKQQIARQKKEEAFSRIYEDFTKEQIRDMNEDLWQQIHLSQTSDSKDFFSIYESVFDGVFS